MFFLPVGGSTANGRAPEGARADGTRASPQGIPPELSNLILQVLAIERIGPLRRGDFVLRTTNLRSWIAADAEHLHQKLILQFAGYRQKESVLSETSIFNRILRKKKRFFYETGVDNMHSIAYN